MKKSYQMASISIPSVVRQCVLTALMLSVCIAFSYGQERVPFNDIEDDGTGPTRSQSGDFVIKGADAYTRGVYSEFGVSSYNDFLTLMNRRGKLSFPLVVDLKTVPGNRVRGHPVRPVAVLNHGYSPNIQVALAESFRFEYLHEEMIRFFIMDLALRNKDHVDKLVERRGGDMVPDWLWAGVTEALRFRDGGEPSELFAAIFEAGNVMTVDEILTADPDGMGSISKAIYRASAGGLVLTLLQQDGGHERMRNFIAALPTSPPDQEALVRKYFPGIEKSGNSLDKWWALQMAQMAKPTALDVLTVAETEASLKRALTIVVNEDINSPSQPETREPRKRRGLRIFRRNRDPEPEELLGAAAAAPEYQRVTYGLADYAMFDRREDLDDVLAGPERQLVQLSYRCFPLHRSLIKGYIEAVEQIKSGDTKDLDGRLAAYAETRAGLLRSARMAEDLMNLYEATTPNSDSGAFDAVLRLAEELRQERPRRDDEISDYLDRIQAEVK